MIRRLAAALLACCALAVSASAQEYPALHAVTGVAQDDVLNIRSAPDAGSPVIGSFAPDETGIEVLARDATGKWGLVNMAEASGWAALRYLKRLDDPAELPKEAQLFCSGTEPFWFLTIDQGQSASLSTPEGGGLELPAGVLQRARGRLDSYFLDLGPAHTGVIRHAECSDGMSDRVYGLSISLIVRRSPAELWDGCCSLAQ